MIGDRLKAAIEKALAAGLRVQLKAMKDGSVKAQIIRADRVEIIAKRRGVGRSLPGAPVLH